MAIIQQIGSYAGLAAVVGLAILSGLYFSQARDVKRLREWAGRAPERVVPAYQQRVVAQPVQRPAAPPQQVPPRPPVPPGTVPRPPARAATAGAAPALATGHYAATPAAARAAESAVRVEGAGLDTDERDVASQDNVAHPLPRPTPQSLPPRLPPPGLAGHFAREAQLTREREEAQRLADERDADEQPDHEHDEDARREDAELEQDRLDDEQLEEEQLEEEQLADEQIEDEQIESEPADEAGDYEDGDRNGDAKPSPPAPPPPVTATPTPPQPAPPPVGPAPSEGPILPPYEQSRPGGTQGSGLSPAKAALAVGGTVLVVAVATYGVIQVVGGDEGPAAPANRSAPADAGRAPNDTKPARPAGIDPGTVTVSVLNGTTVGGLAAQLGDRLEGQGFQLGNVTNNTDQQRAESVVLFAPGAEKEAKEVGRRLKIDQREPIDPDSQTRAGDARVVVIAGADLNH